MGRNGKYDATLNCRVNIIVLFLNNLTLSTFRHPILQARKSKNNYEKHYISENV